MDILLDWKSEEGFDRRVNYLKALRGLVKELRDLNDSNVDKILDKWNVHPVEADEIPRLNIDFP